MTAPSRPHRPFFLFVLLFCLFVLGIGAVGGGLALAAAPQIFFIGYGSLLQAGYALFGVLITVLALLPPLRAYYKQA